MADDSTNPPVTRKEFYVALAMIWLYIAIVIGQFLNDDAKWSLYVLFAAALIMTFTFSIAGIRIVGKSKKTDKPE
jgi:hypothetical protein